MIWRLVQIDYRQTSLVRKCISVEAESPPRPRGGLCVIEGTNVITHLVLLQHSTFLQRPRNGRHCDDLATKVRKCIQVPLRGFRGGFRVTVPLYPALFHNATIGSRYIFF